MEQQRQALLSTALVALPPTNQSMGNPELVTVTRQEAPSILIDSDSFGTPFLESR